MAHVALIASLIWAHYEGLWLWVVGSFLWARWTVFWGAVIGLHRLWSHRSFTTTRPWKLWLMFNCWLCGEGHPITWAIHHRHHHAHSDSALDQHSPHNGFWMAAGLWAIQPIDWFVRVKQFRVIPKDLYRDRDLQWLARWYYPLWAAYIVVTALISIKFMVFFVLAPVAWALTSAALLNTLGHMDLPWSTQPWNTGDRSHNNQLLALVLLGEGLHNNHHHSPSAADQGALTAQLDIAGKIIKRYIEK